MTNSEEVPTPKQEKFACENLLDLNSKQVGRPTKYTPAMCVTVIELGREGASKTEIAAELGISRQNAFYAWQEKYTEFRDAVKEAEFLAQAWWEKKGREATFNSKGFNSTAYIFQMKNRFPIDYRDRPADEGARPPSDQPQIPYTSNPEGLKALGQRYLDHPSGPDKK